jgi:putative heme-binding domain-containing protein
MYRLGHLPLVALLALIAIAPATQSLCQNARTSNLNPLVDFIAQSTATQTRIDILKGMADALKGVQSREMPKGWAQLEKTLAESDSVEVRTLARSLAVKFGSADARKTLRTITLDGNKSLAERENAIASLISISDEQLIDILLALLKEEPFREQAIRGLARSTDPRIPNTLVALYSTLNIEQKRDVLNTLSSRASFANGLLEAVGDGSIPSRDLTASIIRQLRNLNTDAINTKLQEVWGAYREPNQDKLAEMARYRGIYRAGGSTPGNASRGRSIFVRTCQQCHSLFGIGGNVGPDITGSNRSDLVYLLQNVIDPNGVIPNEYQTSTVETEDDRVLTGIVTERNAEAITIATANESIIIPVNDIIDIQASSLSMMPEGLLTALTDQEVRDLFYYLRQPAQAPLIASSDNINLFFNGVDLTGWDGDQTLWSVSDGVLTGKTESVLKHNEFLTSQMVLDDFRLILEVKLTPNSENSGIQFRSRPQGNGEVKGYQADAGAGWWGKLYEELGRGLLWDKSGEQHVLQNQWNRYEILAVGHRIQTAINGHTCVDLNDPDGDLQGMTAFQIHSGGPMTVQFKNFQLELSPEPESLKTVND